MILDSFHGIRMAYSLFKGSKVAENWSSGLQSSGEVVSICQTLRVSRNIVDLW